MFQAEEATSEREHAFFSCVQEQKGGSVTAVWREKNVESGVKRSNGGRWPV